MSEEFKFEDRYIVIKRSDVERFWRDDVRDQFMAALGRLNEHDVRIPQRQYLVIESDWPEFYPAFQMIEARVNGKPAELEVLRAQLANTEQSRRSFFDLSQDLEKRLADRDSLLTWASDVLEVLGKGEKVRERIAALSASAEPEKCESCGGWGHIETEDSAHDCPECGPSLVERAVEAGVMNAPKPYAAMSEAEADEFLSSFGGGSGNKAKRRIAEIEKAKQKTCIECNQPYCHGVCVERGDQDYDRDQAAKGGNDE